MPNVKINLVSTTDRQGSTALKLAHFLKPKYEAEGADVQIIDMREYPLHAVLGGSYDTGIPEVATFNARCLDADGIVMIIPEYNGSFPGIMKLAMDYMPFPNALEHKPMAFIGEASGAFGGLRAVEHMQGVVGYRNALVFPERVFIQRVNAVFQPETGISHEPTASLLAKQTKNFVHFVRKHSMVEFALS